MNIIKNRDEGTSFWRAMGVFILYVPIVSSTVVFLVFEIIKALIHIQENTLPGLLLEEFSGVIAYTMAIILMMKSFKAEGLEKLSIRGRININWTISVLTLFIGYYLFSQNTFGLLLDQIPIPKFIESSFNKIASNNYLMFFSLTITAPIFEEVISRGIILELFLKRYNDFAAIVLSAFIFGLIHMNIPQFINAFLVGLILGYIYLRTRSLALCILGHFINNFIVATMSIIRPDYVSKFNLAQLIFGIIFIALATYIIREQKNKELYKKKTVNLE
ncbi:CPBP family intramembrane glutamic endopeptidase [Clostridium tunisiense]|uniref:CPBP family intramembrane glutamic endopeptidase n=1 Tax=Clostridium tunisiense TaxID=219748 RepID=UPI0002F96D93|nr:CPBP family intramembrane glutamic endopeptidase [Clostridium tunisiense]